MGIKGIKILTLPTFIIILLVSIVSIQGIAGALAIGPVEDVTSGHYYQSIQAAIDDTSTNVGDTIHVSSGTYVENVVVNKTVNLIGDGMPVVDGSGGDAAIFISYDHVTLQGFSVTNMSEGITVFSSNNSVIGNAAYNNIHHRHLPLGLG